MRHYKIAVIRTGQIINVESDKFALDITREYFPDTIGTCGYYSPICVRFWSNEQASYILTSWKMEDVT